MDKDRKVNRLLIHDFPAEEWERTAAGYEGWTVVSDDGTIRPCIGCFNCWSGGEGKCALNDGYARMGELIHAADEVVVMSRYTYGGFSPFIKNVFDRSLGYVLPEFEAAYGEMHHKKRYPEDKPVTFVFRGAGLPEEDKEKARRYVDAVCRNLRGRVKEVRFEEAPACETPDTASPTQANRSGLLFVNCSPRGRRSNAGIFLKQLRDYIGNTKTRAGQPLKTADLAPGADMDKIAGSVAAAETVVLGIPLYVDGLPAPAIRLLQTVKDRGAGRGCRVYALVNNGLYESRQNVNLLGMIKDWCADAGADYCGSLAIGAGELVGTLMRPVLHRTPEQNGPGGKPLLWPVRNARKGILRLAEAVKSGAKTAESFADPFLFPRGLYILIANVNWQKLKRQYRARQGR